MQRRVPVGMPKCPNHDCELEGVPWPLPEKGWGRCPVSGAMFEFEVEQDKEELVQLKAGTMVKKIRWDVRGDEV